MTFLMLFLVILTLSTVCHSEQTENVDVEAGQEVILKCRYKTNDSDIVVLWERTRDGSSDSEALFADRHRETQDEQFEFVNPDKQGNFDLRIKAVQPQQHAGTYLCRYTGEPEQVQRYMLYIKSPPIISISPERSPYVVELNNTFKLKCTASGSPKPTVVWSKNDGELPNGKSQLPSDWLMYSHATQNMAGVYICTANNNVGEPVQANINVEIRIGKPTASIEFKPEEVKISGNLEVICKYDTTSKPIVSWFLNGHRIENNADKKVKIVVEPNQSELSKDNINVEDYGNYSCHVRTRDGALQANAYLGGPPSKANIKADLHDESGLKLSWTVDSILPIQETRFKYRRAKDESFMQAVVNAKKGGSNYEYKAEHSIEKYIPDVEYEVHILSKNIFGWSDEAVEIIPTKKAAAYKQQSDSVTLQSSRSGSSSSASKIFSDTRSPCCQFFASFIVFIVVSFLAL